MIIIELYLVSKWFMTPKCGRLKCSSSFRSIATTTLWNNSKDPKPCTAGAGRVQKNFWSSIYFEECGSHFLNSTACLPFQVWKLVCKTYLWDINYPLHSELKCVGTRNGMAAISWRRTPVFKRRFDNELASIIPWAMLIGFIYHFFGTLELSLC